MVQVTSLRKNKIHLQDYDYETDIKNRLLLSNLSANQVEALEEILFNRLEIPISTFEKNLSHLQLKIHDILTSLLPLKLFTLNDSVIQVDKEKRKYFESQLMKFDEDFHPDMDCLLHLLKKVPIHVLPIWYSIPRTSNNIFQSIIDKFLITPQIYQRYIGEIGYVDPIFLGILEDVFSSPHLCAYGEDLKKKYQLSDEQFQEYVLHFEFNLLGILSYRRTGDIWEEVLTPFHEWTEFLQFSEQSKPVAISNEERIESERLEEFAFLKDLTKILENCLDYPLHESTESLRLVLSLSDTSANNLYVKTLVAKIIQLNMGTITDEAISATEHAKEFISMTLETKALFLYRHPHNQIATKSPASLQEKHQREVERSLKSIVDYGWIYFDDFIKGTFIAFREEQKVQLTKKGAKHWHYQLPTYSPEEIHWIKACIFQGFFECGMIKVGKIYGKDCFSLSDFGQTFFG